MCIAFFYPGRGKGFIWSYLGLIVSLISFLSFSESHHKDYALLIFFKKKNIFTKQIIFLSNLLFPLIKVLQYKMILKTISISFNNHRHNKRTV